MDGALAETKEAISLPSGTTAFPRRSINVTRIKDGGGRGWKEVGEDRYINTARGRRDREAFSKLKVNVVYKRFRREINS